jgi:thymidylate synthase (FAD)
MNTLLKRAISRRKTQLMQRQTKETPHMADVKLISSSSPDLLNDIAYAARVSNPGNQNNKKTSTKLIRYLIKHKHWSPFEMANICLEINTTRDISKQILRHRSFSFQEFSQRYADVSDLGVFQYKECRLQDPTNRQNSVRAPDGVIHLQWLEKQRKVADAALEAYTWALNRGIAKEQARAVLPEGLTPSRLYMNGTIRSWMHYISVRTANGTQKEHIDIAKACAKAISPVFPMIEEFVDTSACLTSV